MPEQNKKSMLLPLASGNYWQLLLECQRGKQRDGGVKPGEIDWPSCLEHNGVYP